MEKDRLYKIVEPLLQWYSLHARVLPWRGNVTPYRVWVSEIMLQQTRVEAVRPYFERFLQTLPSVRALAEADEQALLKLWEGLGYYNRARNLQKAAKIILEKYHGELPASCEELESLPGIGAYTAGAIASIAYGADVPAVDGNVLRVIARILADDSEMNKRGTKLRIQERVREVLPKGRCSQFNQALMELGALICLPHGDPQCLFCPVQSFCKGFADGKARFLPRKSKRKERRVEEKTVFLLLCHGKVAVRRRCQRGVLCGLWEFPTVDGSVSSEEAKGVLHEWGIFASREEKLEKAKHLFSHVEWRMNGKLILVERFPEEQKEFCWLNRQELMQGFALPSAFRFYREELMKRELFL